MKILDFKNLNIRITWTLLLIGFNSNQLLINSQYEERSISADDIIKYAIDSLEDSDDNKVLSLAILSKDEEEKIMKVLIKLSESECCDYNFEFRKFRAMYIYQNMPDSNIEYTQGILKLSALWSKFGFPIDSPNLYFEFKDYSAEKLDILINIHNMWLEKEFRAISNSQVVLDCK